MQWQFNQDRPIYLQIMEQIKLRILSGEYPSGFRLNSVRDLAEEAAVNPNTMQRALSELEREGLVFAQRTSGRMITEDKEMIDTLRKDLAKEQINAFFEKMRTMGFDDKETLELVQSATKESA